MFTDNPNTIAQMYCTPAIGGMAKGQIAHEIDALGETGFDNSPPARPQSRPPGEPNP